LIIEEAANIASSFSWLDYSEQDRRQLIAVIDLFKERETRDELGIGVIRDAFADMLFPGTSTIQTRARYFLFIPWIYKNLEDKNVPRAKFSKRAREEELDLIEPLIKSEDPDGTIGREARRKLKRLPSNIYWYGLGVWDIRRFRGSITAYHNSIEAFYKSNKNSSYGDEEIEGGFQRRHNWDPSLPLPPKGFPQEVSFKLAREEAEYLKDKVMSCCPGTMLYWLLHLEENIETAEFPWQFPNIEKFPPDIREQLIHAQNFSEAIYGSVLLYNLMLAKKLEESDWGNDQVLTKKYRNSLEIWADNLCMRGDELSRWDYKKRFYQIVVSNGGRPSPRTKDFINAWLEMALSPGGAKRIADSSEARKLIYNREITLKKALARLENKSTLQLWQGASGTSPLKYRWNPTKRIVMDILEGLKRG
jgi:hypothetical protein